VEIPLEKGVINGSGKSGDIAYLNIDRIFSAHPMKNRLKAEFEADVEKRKAEIVLLSGAVADLNKIVVSTTTEINHAKLALMIIRSTQAPAIEPAAVEVSSANASSTVAAVSSAPASVLAVLPGVSASTASAAGILTAEALEKEISVKEAFLAELNATIGKKKDEIRALTRKNKDELTKTEEKLTARVLADIYNLLEKLAVEEGYSIIIDKNNVLYGQSGQDITDKIIERLQGR